MKHQSLTPVFTLILSLATGCAYAAEPEWMTELRQLRAEVAQLKEQMAQLRPATLPAEASVSTGTPDASPATVPAAISSSTAYAPSMEESRVSLFGYGEMYYSRPLRNTAETMATARRGVLGLAYRFNDRTRFAAELEIENAVVSASDQGEAAFEQLYLEHDLSDEWSLKAGLFLLPLGYLNESHEPTRYFGVTRNQVETAIIPTTWREMGLGLQGRTLSGWRWNTGLVTSFDLNKWPTSDEGRSETRESPLGAIHQEGQQAKAASMAYYGAINYDGIVGLNVGGGLFSGGVNQKQMETRAIMKDARVNLYEMHAKWQQDKWAFTALTALGQFQGVSSFNATGIANPVPREFRGWYAQAAYKIWQQGDQSLWPFTRYERLNTARGYAGLPNELMPITEADTRTITTGLSYYLHPQVVVKVDAQKFLNNSQLDRINMGVGFHY